jgi:hypothetical protein
LSDGQRKRLFDALLGDVSVLEPGCTARLQLEKSALGQLDEIEPVVVDLIIEVSEAAWR